MSRIIVLLILFSQLIYSQDYWMGIPYPMNRWGVSVMGVTQTEKGDLKSASVQNIKLHESIPNLNVNFLNPHDMKVDAKVQIVKVDYMLLPFLGVYGIGGKLEAEAKFKLGKGSLNFDSTGKPLYDKILTGIGNEIANSMPASLDIKQKSEGKLLGGGVILAGEYNKIFTSFQYTYTTIKMDGDVATKSAEIGAAKLGYAVYRNNGNSVMPYVGASYQKTNTEISGVIPKTSLNYRFEVDLEDITPAIGTYITIKENFTILMEYSFGDRELFALDLGYRF